MSSFGKSIYNIVNWGSSNVSELLLIGNSWQNLIILELKYI